MHEFDHTIDASTPEQPTIEDGTPHCPHDGTPLEPRLMRGGGDEWCCPDCDYVAPRTGGGA